MARTTKRKYKTDRIRQSFPFRCKKAEKKHTIIELEILAVVWGVEHFRLHVYGKPINLLTDHQALEPLIKRNRFNKKIAHG